MKLLFILTHLLIFTLVTNCLNKDEYKNPLDQTNPVGLLLGLFVPRYAIATAASAKPLSFRVSGGNLFLLAAFGYPTVYESTDGITFQGKIFELPNCVTVIRTEFVHCKVISISKFNSTYYAIAVKQTGISINTAPFATISESVFYFASGSSLESLSFQPISNSNFKSTNPQYSDIRSAASSAGFAIYFKPSSDSGAVCGTANSGGTWSCITNPSGIYEGFLENLNGTLTYDRYYRWVGGAFASTGVTGWWSARSAIHIGGRTILAQGNDIQYTSTDPSVWSTPIATTASTINSNNLSGTFIYFGTLSGSLRAINREYNPYNPDTFIQFSSTDNGANWSRVGSLSFSDPDMTRDIYYSDPIIFNEKYYLRVQGRNASYALFIKYFTSVDLVNWTEFFPVR
jgi:hypothetical protein